MPLAMEIIERGASDAEIRSMTSSLCKDLAKK